MNVSFTKYTFLQAYQRLATQPFLVQSQKKYSLNHTPSTFSIVKANFSKTPYIIIRAFDSLSASFIRKTAHALWTKSYQHSAFFFFYLFMQAHRRIRFRRNTDFYLLLPVVSTKNIWMHILQLLTRKSEIPKVQSLHFYIRKNIYFHKNQRIDHY